MKKWLKLLKFDPIIFIIPILLVIISLSTIYTITFANNGYKLVLNQLVAVLIGIAIAGFITYLDYKFWRSTAFSLYLIGIVLLIVVSIFGANEFGASRWIELGFFRLQPSELMKIFLVLIIARFLETRFGRIKWYHILIGLFIASIPFGLVLKQPDLGTATVFIAILISLYIGAKISWKYILSILVLFVISLPFIWTNLHDYQRERVMTFINPSSDPYGSGYNVLQSMIAVGSGGIFGQGFGQGSQSQLNYLPVAHADFIFAGFAESAGFVGSVILLILFLIFLWRVFYISKIAPDKFGALVSLGFGAMFLWQVFINIGMNIGVAPVTGIPLPFMSYGGSSIIANFIALGILQNIYIRSKSGLFDD